MEVFRWSEDKVIELTFLLMHSSGHPSYATILPLFIGKLINQIQLEGVTQTNIGDIFGIIFILVLICFLVTIFTFVWSVQGERARVSDFFKLSIPID